MLGVEHFDLALLDEIELLNTRLIADKRLPWPRNLTVELHDNLIDKAILAFFEEMIKSLE